MLEVKDTLFAQLDITIYQTVISGSRFCRTCSAKAVGGVSLPKFEDGLERAALSSFVVAQVARSQLLASFSATEQVISLFSLRT